MFNALTPGQQKLLLDASREPQERIRELTESVDTLAKAKELLEPKGMKVNTADVDAFRKIAQGKCGPPTSDRRARPFPAPACGRHRHRRR